jgi:hypothetical protein
MPDRIAFLMLSALLALVVGAAPQAAADQSSGPAAQETPLLVTATNAPLRVLGSDGMEHLEYDLIITNVFTAPLTLTAVEVVTPDGHPLLRLAGDALVANTEPIFFPAPDAAPISQIPVGGVVAVVVDLRVPPGEVPARISHHIAYELPPDAPALALIASRAVTGPELTVDPRSALVLAPPLRGDGWVSINGCCDAFSVHRSPRIVVDGARYVKPETFAIDWLQLQDRRPWTGDGTENAQYFAFGAEVVSVADGTVVSVRDDMPEETPNQAPAAVQQPGDYIGNHVVVQLQPEVWAVYAHLQPGSIPVREGERVTTGQLVGRLGNSGNSTAPHLHFQLSDGSDALTSTSLPFVFGRYTLVGTVDAVDSDAPGPPALRVGGTPRAQTGTYPLVNTVQDFR